MTNLDRLRESMANASIPALLVTHIPNVQWLTGFTGSFGFAVVTPTSARFGTDSRYTLQAQEEVVGFDVSSFQNPTTQAEFLAQELAAAGAKDVAFDRGTVTVATFEEWQAKIPNVTFQSAADPIARLRMVKSPAEIEKIRAACRLADACFDHVVRLIQPGVREYDIALDIEFFFRRQGAKLAFEPIVVSGLRSARPHGRASEKTLEVGDFVTLDFGAELDGYCSDITRTVVVGQATPRHHEVYEAVLRANMTALSFLKPGITGVEADASARNVLAEVGLAEYFGHGLGHGLGTLVHDGGRLSPRSEDVLEVGQVWTVEPGVYIEGFGGVRIEDDVVITETGVEILTSSPKHLMVLPTA